MQNVPTCAQITTVRNKERWEMQVNSKKDLVPLADLFEPRDGITHAYHAVCT